MIFNICFFVIICDHLVIATNSNKINSRQVDVLHAKIEDKYFPWILSKNKNHRKTYFKNKLKPKIIVKRESPEEKKGSLETFVYDDEDIENKSAKSKFDFEGNPDSTESMQRKASSEERNEEKSGSTNIDSKTINLLKEERKILPDFIIDQIVYEESETNVESLKSSVQSLEKLVTNNNEKDKHTFSKIYSDITALYNEVEQLKKNQDELKKENSRLRSDFLKDTSTRVAITSDLPDTASHGCQKALKQQVPNTNIYYPKPMLSTNPYMYARTLINPHRPLNVLPTIFNPIMGPRLHIGALLNKNVNDNIHIHPFLYGRFN